MGAEMIPFSDHCTADYPTCNNRHRLEVYRKFIKCETLYGRVLDIGAENYIGLNLGVTDFTDGDLNWTLRARLIEYDIVTCFEVMNKLMNHELFMRSIHSKLKPGGTVYFSIPKPWLIQWGQHTSETYADIKPHALQKLFKYTGFEVVRWETHSPWPWYFVFYGLRPPFRYLFNRIQLYELRRV